MVADSPSTLFTTSLIHSLVYYLMTSAQDLVILDMEQTKSIRLSRIALVAFSLVGHINVGKPTCQRHLPERFHGIQINASHFVRFPSTNRVQQAAKVTQNNVILIVTQTQVVMTLQMLCTCYTCNQGTWPLNIIHGPALEL
jgi:hypothetical protein